MFQLGIIFILVLINGVLAASELAVVSARISRLQAMADEGVGGAAKAVELAESPSRFLSAVQIGISLVGILAGAFGGASVANVIASTIQDLPIVGGYAQTIGLASIVLLTTYLSLVVGELTPKRIALRNPERIAARVAPFMTILATVTAPVIHIINGSSNLLLSLLGKTEEPGNEVSTDEIKLLIEEGRESGVIEPEEEEMINRVFRLADRKIKALMTPRTNVAWLDLQAAPDTLGDYVTETGFSRYPVADGSLDNIQGIVLAKDLLARCYQEQPIDLPSMMRPALFTPESLSAIQVIERFKANYSKIAIVIDEYGGVEGITTVDDVLEAIVGDILDRGDNEEEIVIQRHNDGWLLDAHLPLDEFQERFNIPSLPEDAGTKYQTVGGLVMDVLGQIPQAGDMLRWQNVRVRIEQMNGRQIDKIAVLPDDEHGQDPDTD